MCAHIRRRGLAFLLQRIAFGIARRCVSVAALCARHRPALRSCRGVLPSSHACCLPPCAKQGRLAVSCVPVPPGRDRHSCVLVMSARLSAFAGSLRVWPFLCGDPDGVPGIRGTGYGVRENEGWRRGLCAFCAITLALPCFPRGVRWGLRAPKPAPRRPVSLDSLHLIRGRVRFTQRGACALYAAQL